MGNGSRCSVIYIPVWIDLKITSKADFMLEVKIYIPVWIDLKLFQSVHFFYTRENLHSSMDRFEATDGITTPLYTMTFTFQYG